MAENNESINQSRVRSLAYIGLSIALISVSAWITIPFGPVPFTLQVFAIVFSILVLSPKEALVTMGGYLLLGAIGAPVFSGMRGGIGVLAGPTGGYLWGWLVGVVVAVALLHVVKTRNDKGDLGKKKDFAFKMVACFAFLLITYICGWAQFMAVTQVGAVAAFMTTIAPFILIDVVKIVAAVMCAQAVRTALQARR